MAPCFSFFLLINNKSYYETKRMSFSLLSFLFSLLFQFYNKILCAFTQLTIQCTCIQIQNILPVYVWCFSAPQWTRHIFWLYFCTQSFLPIVSFSKHWNKHSLFIYPVPNACRLPEISLDFTLLYFIFYCHNQTNILAKLMNLTSDLTLMLMVTPLPFVSSLAFSPQPLNPRQAMVKRLSVVNLENFRRQYARRRWKVKSWSSKLFLYSEVSGMSLGLFCDSPPSSSYVLSGCRETQFWIRGTSCPPLTG